MTHFAFAGAAATGVRPARQPSESRGLWAKDATSAEANDGTRLDATFLNDLVAGLRRLIALGNAGAIEGDDDAIADAVEAWTNAAVDVRFASPALTGTPTAPTAAPGTNTTQISTTAFVAAAIAGLLASPALTGTPTAPTAANGTNTTQLATTAFVQAAIALLLDSAPGTLNTLNELAAALGDDPNFATTVTNALALKAPLASPALTGTPTAPTAATGTNTTQIATMAAVLAEVALEASARSSADALKAPLASPALTGTPTAPTASPGTNTTQIATMAAIQAAVDPEATAAEYRANTANKTLTTDKVWAAADLVTLTDAATVAVDMSTFLNAVVTLAGNRALGNPTNAKPGQSGVILIKQDGTGSRTLSYGSNWKFPGAVAPVLTTTASRTDKLHYWVESSSVIHAELSKDSR